LRGQRTLPELQKRKIWKLCGEEQIKLLLKFTGEAARYVKEYESKKADFLVEEKRW